jgi:hypothetical protein
MKKVLMLVVAGTFSVSAAAYACDGAKDSAAKASKASTVAKKETPGKGKTGEAKPKS